MYSTKPAPPLRKVKLPRLSFDPALPVSARRAEIRAAIERHQVVIVCGETGSGKTTQLPKILLEMGRGAAGLIGHTQPRRIAARSVAARIAEELGSELGAVVGYKVRFQDRLGPDAAVKLMTDGILLAETQGDPQLRQYDTIVIDEAHERSLNIDFLLGYLVRLLPRRPDLKLVITSATIDAERFSRHFGGAPVIEVSGRLYPVEVRYRPVGGDAEDTTRKEEEQALGDAVDELCAEGPGDVLVFLPGEREIRDAAEVLRKRHPPNTELLPLYSRLSAAEQDRVFRPGGARRIVLATNVAETSLTVPRISFVVDTGLARVKRYSYRNKVEQLRVENISQAAAKQRAGRCGRVADGVCIRLYAQEEHDRRAPFTDPEVLRSSLAAVILRAASLGLGAVEDFPFLDPPSPRAIADGYALLAELGAVDEAKQLTETGRELARLPLDPRIGRMLIAARRESCLEQLLVIASALSVQDPRVRPMDNAAAADERHKRFADERSDFLALLKLWQLFEGKWEKACRENFLSIPRMREWRDVHSQLHSDRGRARLARLERGPGESRRLPSDPPRAACRAARQRRPARGGGRELHRRARDQVLGPSRLVDAQAGQVARRRRAGRDHAPVRANGRRDRAAVARGPGRAPDQAPARTPALGEGARASGRAGARHAVRAAGVRQPAHPLRAARAGARARDLHPLGAGRRRLRDPRAVLRPQSQAAARDRAARAQVTPARHSGRRRADPRVLRRADSGGHSQRRRFREVAQGDRARGAAAAVPAARGPDAARGGRHHHRELPAAAAARLEYLRARVHVRARLAARRGDAHGAGRVAEPGSGGALRVAGAGAVEGEGAAAGEVDSAAAAPQAGAAR